MGPGSALALLACPGRRKLFSRREDHTTSPYASVHSSALARLNKSVHRISHPTCRDDHDTPLLWARDGRSYNSDFQNCEAKYFLFWGLTRFPKIRSDLPRLRQPPSSEGGLRRVKRLRRARPSC